ncbi:MAG: HAD hydrolase-like protein [Paracoccaceae bacterium]
MARIVFDLDGTLVHSTPTLCAAGNRLLAELGRGPVAPGDYAGFVGHGMAHQVGSLLKHTGGIPAEGFDACLTRFREIYDADPVTGTEVYDGVPACLEALAASGHRLGVCTQKPSAPTRGILEATGLAPFLSGVTTGDSLDVLKPEPAMLEHTAAQMGDGPLIFVGDSETDALTAASAKVPFLLHVNGYRQAPVAEIPHDAAFDSFGELPELVARTVVAA